MAVALASSGAAQARSSIVVGNCNDDGAGSLRDAVNRASPGDVVDLTTLTCSTITLTTGAIATIDRDLDILGPGPADLLVNANGSDRAFVHLGTGQLRLTGMSIRNGRKYVTDDFAKGGCISSSGKIVLSNAVVSDCVANTTDPSSFSAGGAIYARNGVELHNVTVQRGRAIHAVNANGGALATPGPVSVSDSVVEGNVAYSKGGGIFAGGGVTITNSLLHHNYADTAGGIYSNGGSVNLFSATIANNYATLGGGLVAVDGGGTSTLRLSNATISTNRGTHAGVYVVEGFPSAKIENSTIAFNRLPEIERHSDDIAAGAVAAGSTASVAFVPQGAGLFLGADVNVELQSTIIANNLTEGTPDDLGGLSGAAVATVSANNLVMAWGLPLPLATLPDDPRLGPLSRNGLSWTHSLQSGSPGIDAGNNLAGLVFDARGSGHPRTIGAGTDIGAFELDTDEVIFADGFD